MSTTPIDTWAVDLADVTAIYPAVGTEVAMAWIAIVLWIGWHVWQLRHENSIYEEEKRKYGGSDNIQKAISGD